MKKKCVLFLLLSLSSLFIVGCAVKTPEAPSSNKITFDTGVGTGAENIVALPAALEGQPYFVIIAPSGGAAPHICASVPAGSFIVGNIRLTNTCTITGIAPMLSPGTTHGIYPVIFTITDANGVLAGPFQLALEIVKPEQRQGAGAIQPNRQTGRNPPILNIPSQMPNAPVFRKYNESVHASGGEPPYLYSCEWSKENLGLWCYEGVILGQPLEENIGNYSLNYCVYGNNKAYSCYSSSISVVKEEETWTGTFHTSRPACYDFDTETTQGRFDGVFTATMTIPAKLADLISNPNDFDTDRMFSYDKKNYHVTWSGSESVAEQCHDVEKHDLYHYQAVGNSVSNNEPRIGIWYGTTNVMIGLTSELNSPLLPGGYDKYRRDISESTLSGMVDHILLIPTSVSDTVIKGKISFTQNGMEIGTFTLTKQQ